MKIGVLTESQNPSVDKALCFVSKNAAFRMCRQGTHEKIGRGLIRKLKQRLFPPGYIFAYIPDKMPPINVPNTIFRPPATNWNQKYAGIPFMESLSQ